jgi:hypothetical protein
MFRTIVYLSLLTLTSAHVCIVCGEGKIVGSPDSIFTFPGQPSVSCKSVELAGLEGLISEEQCPFVASHIDTCNCVSRPITRITQESPSTADAVLEIPSSVPSGIPSADVPSSIPSETPSGEGGDSDTSDAGVMGVKFSVCGVGVFTILGISIALM